MIPYGLSLMKVDSLVMKDRNYYSLYQKVTVNLPVLNVLITFTVLQMTLFGATWSHCYTRMAYLIRTRLSDLCTVTRREVFTFREETVWYSCTPGCKPSYLCPASNHRRSTSWGVNID